MDREESSIEPDFQIKVYRPAPSEFANMKDYIQRLEKDSGTKNGICKVRYHPFYHFHLNYFNMSIQMDFLDGVLKIIIPMHNCSIDSK